MCSGPSHHFHLTRRSMLAGAVAALAVPLARGTALAQASFSPDAALSRLLEGNARYVASGMRGQDKSAKAGMTRSITALLSCADAPAGAEMVFDQGPEDIFVVRLAGNIVTEGAVASLEYAVQFLNVPLVMVLGHTGCSTVAAVIQALQNNTVLPGHMPDIVAAIRPAVEVAQATGSANQLEATIAENVRQSVGGLSDSAPILATAASGGQIKIVGAVLDLATSKVALV